MTAHQEYPTDVPHVISLGAGVQSSTMALMAAHGLIRPMPAFAVFADTQAEPPSVYRWLDWLETQLPFPVRRVTQGNLAEDSVRLRRSKKSGKLYADVTVPLRMRKSDGTKGLLQRRCTQDYKITPILRELRRAIGRSKQSRVVQWIGISIDEVMRMKPARVPWTEHRWPLIDLKMTRQDCLRWMAVHNYPTPPRSACVFCPYHNNSEWLRLKINEPAAFAQAVSYERAAQQAVAASEVLDGTPFLHSSLAPLEHVPLEALAISDNAQLALSFGDECEGMCGV